MRSAGSSNLIPLDLEIERTCRKNRKNLKNKKISFSQHMYNMETLENQRPLRDYATPLVDGIHDSIQIPTIQANNFELKPSIIQMVQNSQFGGSALEDRS